MNIIKIMRKWKLSQNESYRQHNIDDDTAERIVRKTFMYIDENCKKRKIDNIEIRIFTSYVIINLKEEVEFNSVKQLKQIIQLRDILINKFNLIEGIKVEKLTGSFIGVKLTLKTED